MSMESSPTVCTYEHWVTIYRKWWAFGFHDVQIAHVGTLWRPLISRHWTVRTLQVSLSKNPGIPLLTGWRRVGKRVKLRGRASIPPGYLRTYKNLRGSGGSWNSHLNSNISEYTCRFGMHRIKAHYAPVYCRMECDLCVAPCTQKFLVCINFVNDMYMYLGWYSCTVTGILACLIMQDSRWISPLGWGKILCAFVVHGDDAIVASLGNIISR